VDKQIQACERRMVQLVPRASRDKVDSILVAEVLLNVKHEVYVEMRRAARKSDHDTTRKQRVAPRRAPRNDTPPPPRYSKLIHTVDHVEGYLRRGFDALDAFLCHTWAVTVTGAPKAWAARFIEKHERSARAW